MLLVSFTEEHWLRVIEKRVLKKIRGIWAKEGQGNRGLELHDLYSPNTIGVIRDGQGM
jgi:hypothetical protein